MHGLLRGWEHPCNAAGAAGQAACPCCCSLGGRGLARRVRDSFLSWIPVTSPPPPFPGCHSRCTASSCSSSFTPPRPPCCAPHCLTLSHPVCPPPTPLAALPGEAELVSPWEVEVDPEEERRRADEARRAQQAAARAHRARQGSRRWVPARFGGMTGACCAVLGGGGLAAGRAGAAQKAMALLARVCGSVGRAPHNACVHAPTSFALDPVIVLSTPAAPRPPPPSVFSYAEAEGGEGGAAALAAQAQRAQQLLSYHLQVPACPLCLLLVDRCGAVPGVWGCTHVRVCGTPPSACLVLRAGGA
jgi:hypothetical protein